MLFKKDNHPVYPLSFENCVLEDKECHKHLGLIFESNCKWEKHINNIIMKCTFYSNPAPRNGSMQFHYCTLVTREPEQTTLLF